MENIEHSNKNSIDESTIYGSKEIFSLMNQLKLVYSSEERQQILKELNLDKGDSIVSDILIQRCRENKPFSKFKHFYENIISLIATPLELVVHILTESRKKMVFFKEERLAEELEWVIKEIKNDSIYNYNLNGLSASINSETELGKTMRLISEYSTDNFTRNKKDDLIAARKFSTERMSLVTENKNKLSILPISLFKRNEFNPTAQSKQISIIVPSISPRNSQLEEAKLIQFISETDEYDKLKYSIDSNKFNEFDFNIFKYIENEGREKCLSKIAFSIFSDHNLFCFVNINMFESFINKIQVGYDYLLPYHNEIHAADVLQTSNIFVRNSNIQEQMDLTILDISGFFIAAIIHDYKHPGKNNNFLINTRNDLALRYNDVSVLENYHVSSAFKVITHKNSQIFSELKNEEYRVVRKRIVECVLATDMAKHYKAIASIKLKLENFSNSKSKDSFLVKLISEGDDESNFDRQQEILNYFIHCADISNSAKEAEISKRWTNLIMSENFLQGDQELQLGLPISFLCDRRNTNVAESQISFITKIVIPCFNILIQISPDLNFLKENIISNLQMWESELD